MLSMVGLPRRQGCVSFEPTIIKISIFESNSFCCCILPPMFRLYGGLSRAAACTHAHIGATLGARTSSSSSRGSSSSGSSSGNTNSSAAVPYLPSDVEKKWNRVVRQRGTAAVGATSSAGDASPVADGSGAAEDSMYILSMFPYPRYVKSCPLCTHLMKRNIVQPIFAKEDARGQVAAARWQCAD